MDQEVKILKILGEVLVLLSEGNVKIAESKIQGVTSELRRRIDEFERSETS